MNNIVIIGSGQAGITLAKEVRKLNADTPITLVTADDGSVYYKPNLSKALAMEKSAADLVTQSAAELAEQLGVEVITDCRVESINREAKSLVTSKGEIEYQQLVLATGANCIEVPIAGDAAAAVLQVNNLQQYDLFRQKLSDSSRVLLIGAGLIGSEFANDLSAAGHKVSVVDPMQWPLGRMLPESAGKALQAGLTDLGATFYLGTTVSELTHAGDCIAVRLDNGDCFDVDVVLSAVGLRPDAGLAQAAGLDTERGVVVNPLLQSSDPSIYALGDVAEVEGLVLPYVMPIMNGARALAKTLTGEPTELRYPVMPVMVKTPACPTLVCPPPHSEGEWQAEGEGSDWACTFVDKDSQAIGFALTGAATKRRMEFAKQVPSLLA